MEEYGPMLLNIAGAVLSLVIAWAAFTAKRKWNIEIEAKHRDALHMAFMTAARLALAKQLTGAAALQLALDYARKSVPDALDYLRPSVATQKELAESKLQTVTQGIDAFEAGKVLGDSLKGALR